MKEPKHPGKAPKRPKKPQEPPQYIYGGIGITPFTFEDYLPDLWKQGRSAKEIAATFLLLYEEAVGYPEEDMIHELNTKDRQLDYFPPSRAFKNVDDCLERSEEFIKHMCKRYSYTDIFREAYGRSFSLQDLIELLPDGVEPKDVHFDHDHYWDMTMITASYRLPDKEAEAKRDQYEKDLKQYQKDLEEYKKLSAEHKKKMAAYKQKKTKFDKLLNEKIEQMKKEGIQ